MQTFKKAFVAAMVAILALPLSPAPVATAASPELFLQNIQGVGVANGAVSTDVGLLVKYVGTAGGVVTVDAATGDITLETGVVGTVVADATTECPVSGALGGVIDVSNAACDTLGEVVDAINASPNWVAVIVDGLRSDLSTNTLITKAATSAATAKGVQLLKDTTVALNVTNALIPSEMRSDIRTWMTGNKLNPNPFADSQTVFEYGTETFTGTGADTVSVLSVEVKNVDGGPAVASTAASIISSAQETSTTLLSKAGGGTTVLTNLEFQNTPIYGRRGEKLLFRVAAATTFTAYVGSSTGLFGNFKKSQ